MPTGPRGERRPADVIGGSVIVARLSFGGISEPLKEPSGKDRSGKVGGAARAKTLTSKGRPDIARNAANRRWITNHV